MKQIILGAVVFIAAGAASVGHFIARTEIRATEEVCALVRENYFRAGDEDVRKFLKACEADSIPFESSRARAVRDINRRLAQIRSSHLSLYTPDENRRLWTNSGTDTGLRSRMIDGELVITSVLENSPASTAQLKAGDVVISINDEAVSSADDAQSTAGSFKIARSKKFFLVDLQLDDVSEDLQPKLDTGAGGLAVGGPGSPSESAIITIPSFLPQYFADASWITIAEKVERKKHAVIDLRGNPGGSFPAMLKVLSLFRCGGESVGVLWRLPKSGDAPAMDLSDDLDATHQLELLRKTNEVRLRTFKTDDASRKPYPCFRGDAVVLVDNGTSSVSEVFAKAMLARPQTKVWGWPTAGQVVMARWFEVGALGGGDYAMSIPIAGYRADDGDEIEHQGVRPKRELHYDLETALRGEDSWIDEAVKSLTR